MADSLGRSPGEGERLETTRLLVAWSDGDAAALDELTPRIYDSLRRLAASQLRHERPNHTLQTAALVNEAFLRLIEQDRVRWRDRAHFLAVAARMMRRILVDHARRRSYVKHGGGLRRVSLEGAAERSVEARTDLVSLDEALEALARIEPERARVVELRYFGGLTQEEIAAVLGIGEATVTRRWRSARAWLYRYLEGEGSPPKTAPGIPSQKGSPEP